jgi:hypothetical protein
VTVMSSVAKVALVCVIVLCDGLFHRYVPRDLYLHCWTVVYSARRVALWVCLLAASVVYSWSRSR